MNKSHSVCICPHCGKELDKGKYTAITLEIQLCFDDAADYRWGYFWNKRQLMSTYEPIDYAYKDNVTDASMTFAYVFENTGDLYAKELEATAALIKMARKTLGELKEGIEAATKDIAQAESVLKNGCVRGR